MRVIFLLTVCGLISAGGCAHYEYDLVQPADFAQRIGTKSGSLITLAPIRYEARSVSDRLVLFIHNQSNDAIKLQGDDSFAVDPRGESHPIPTRTIAPGSSTKLIFPPVRPTIRQSGPVFGFGVGMHVSSRREYHGGYPYGDPFYNDYPRYYRVEDDGTVYWDWGGNGTSVKVRLVYSQGEKTFHHDFTFRRVKV
jgi:hypothetical protein